MGDKTRETFIIIYKFFSKCIHPTALQTIYCSESSNGFKDIWLFCVIFICEPPNIIERRNKWAYCQIGEIRNYSLGMLFLKCVPWDGLKSQQLQTWKTYSKSHCLGAIYFPSPFTYHIKDHILYLLREKSNFSKQNTTARIEA